MKIKKHKKYFIKLEYTDYSGADVIIYRSYYTYIGAYLKYIQIIKNDFNCLMFGIIDSGKILKINVKNF